ncbi:metallophosphoesterase [Liquorilactobacillus satsumensis]|nr:metallophosphoesterase [Liquorilactobacillus satsumensis]MCP9312627.1 metallophosphoesterase [Liquorilactobacillus satsumensis]MCP9359813.1 metallophosphoesterase [Liquorilactobacillus satsumensis]
MKNKKIRFLVVSDSHGDREILEKLRAKYQGKVDGMFHCGDSELAPDDELFTDFQVVMGNCDYDPRFKELILTEYGSERVLLTHGHLYGVNNGMERLGFLAASKQATIVLFGHTHLLGAEYRKKCLFLNPGSISFPRGEYSSLGGTYAVLEVTPEAFKLQFYARTFKEIPELAFTFKRN